MSEDSFRRFRSIILLHWSTLFIDSCFHSSSFSFRSFLDTSRSDGHRTCPSQICFLKPFSVLIWRLPETFPESLIYYHSMLIAKDLSNVGSQAVSSHRCLISEWDTANRNQLLQGLQCVSKATFWDMVTHMFWTHTSTIQWRGIFNSKWISRSSLLFSCCADGVLSCLRHGLIYRPILAFLRNWMGNGDKRGLVRLTYHNQLLSLF